MTTITEPPRVGRGSSRAAWAAYAESLGIDVPDDLGRDGIIDLIDADPFSEEEENAVTDQSIAELEAELAAERETSKAALAAKDAEIEAMKPTKNVAKFMFDTPEDVEEFFGGDTLDEMVDHEIAAENRELSRRGYPHKTVNAATRAERREKLVAGLIEDRHKVRPPVDGWLACSLKMVHPNGSLRQIAYEGQVNNVAGSLADGYVRYERKGFKRTEPMLCPTMDCWEQAATNNLGKWEFDGFCTKDHLDRTMRGVPVPAQ